MFERDTLHHHIQRHVMKVLLFIEYARFRDLRPKNVDTNLFSYHLKLLQQNQLVKKTDKGYTLSQNGLMYVDRLNAKSGKFRTQPKIITMLLVQDEEGRVLIQKRNKQPYINRWTLPYGKLHIEDPTLRMAAQREAEEKLGIQVAMGHAGDCYIRAYMGDQLISTTLAHIFRASVHHTNHIVGDSTLQWIRPLDLTTLLLAPAVEQIVARSFFGDKYFFEEYDCRV